ncbi:MAG TPA: response regulator [Marmoricola sp.]|nr:response regulator [Marmoricola sp.]
MKILIVDDSRVMRQIVVRTLRQAGLDGHDIVEAENGKLGFDAVLAHQPDLVLSDWNMPEMTGIEMLHALRANGHQVPLGFVTSEGSPEMVAKAHAGGAMFVITKPFTPEGFRDALEPVLV